MDDPPFKKCRTETCDLVSLDYKGCLPAERAYASNSNMKITCGRTLPLDYDKNVELRYTIPATPMFIDCLRMSFHLTLKIVNGKSGLDLDVDEKLGVICAPLYTSFSRLRLLSKGKIVKEWNYYPWLCHMPMLCGYSNDYLDTVLRSEAGFVHDSEPVLDQSFNANRSLKYFRGRLQRSKKLDLMTRPFVPAFFHNKKLPTKCEWTLEWTMNPSDFVIRYLKEGLKELKLRLLRADLIVNTVDLEPEARALVDRQLNSNGLWIPFTDYQAVSLSIQEGQSEFTSSANTMRFPRRVYIGFVAEEDVLPNPATTPFYYRNWDIMQLEFNMNGRRQAMALNFDDDQYIEGYHRLIQTMSVCNRGSAITSYQWAFAQTIFSFDCTPGQTAGCLDSISMPSETATWSLAVQFQKRLPKNVQCFLVFEMDSNLHIDSEYNASVLSP